MSEADSPTMNVSATELTEMADRLDENRREDYVAIATHFDTHEDVEYAVAIPGHDNSEVTEDGTWKVALDEDNPVGVNIVPDALTDELYIEVMEVARLSGLSIEIDDMETNGGWETEIDLMA